MSLMPWRNKTNELSNRTESSGLAELRSQMDQMFDSFLREPFGDWGSAFGAIKSWAPTIDVAQDEHEITVRAEVPGIDPKELDLTIEGDHLVISGEKKESTEKKVRDYYQVESRYGSFKRSVKLPPGADPQLVAAEYSNGVLTVRLQKSEAAKSKKIEVKTD